MDELIFIKRKKGTVLLLNGRQHYKQRAYKNDASIWNCSLVRKEKCRGSVTIQGNRIIKSVTHSCVADYTKNDIDVTIDNMKEQARLTDTPIPQIYNSGIKSLKNKGAHFVSDLPPLKSLKTSLYTNRNKTNFKNASDVVIPEKFESFMLADYCYEDCRIIIFCSEEGRRLMEGVDECFLDGTFSSCPGPFDQLYSIHGDICKSSTETNVVPLVYALMTDKKQESYRLLFEIIKKQIPQWSPKKVHLDFEIAVSNAVVQIFPDVEIKKCYYHFTKSLWKKAKALKLNSKNERRIVGLCTALPLLPETEIDNGMEYIKGNCIHTPKITKFFKYMDMTWFKINSRKQWSVFGERHRTNNVVESWHSQLNKEIKKRLPVSILRLLNVLSEKENFSEEAKKRRQEHLERDEYILKCQMELIRGDISIGFFLEKLR